MSDVVWDSTRLRIVKNMNESECLAMVKSIARRLRNQSAVIQQAFSGLSEARFLNAKFLTEEKLELTLDTESKQETGNYHHRRKELVDKDLADIMVVMKDYRRDAGYRFLCLLALAAEDGHEPETVKVASALRLLGRAQSAHLETLALIDRVRALQKLKKSDHLALAEEQVVLMRLMGCHLATTLQVFKKIEAPVESKSLIQHYEENLNSHSEWSESHLVDLKSAESAVRTFRLANEAYTGKIWSVVSEYTQNKLPEARVFRAAS